MTAPDLKPCPACGRQPVLLSGHAWACPNGRCEVVGTRDDPDGAKWNALPRRGTGKEMEELRAALAEWRGSIADDELAARGGEVRLRVRRAIDAVLAAAPCAAQESYDTSPGGLIPEARAVWLRSVLPTSHWVDVVVRTNGKTFRVGAEFLKRWAAERDGDGDAEVAQLTKELDELRAVVSSFATEREERDAVAARLAKQRDEALSKAEVLGQEVTQAHNQIVQLIAEASKLRQQIAALKELVREFAREGGDGK